MNIERKTFKFASATALAVLAGFCGDTQALAQGILYNTGNTPNGDAAALYDSFFGESESVAQSFTTGNNSYTLNTISPVFDSGNGNGFQLSLYSDNAGTLGSPIAVLTGTDSPSAGSQVYTPATTISLQPLTTYWFVASTLQTSDANFQLPLTPDTSSVSSDGWTVGNSSLYSTGNGWSTPNNGEVLQFSIGATITPVPEPSTLALTAAGCVAGAVIFRRRRSAID